MSGIKFITAASGMEREKRSHFTVATLVKPCPGACLHFHRIGESVPRVRLLFHHIGESLPKARLYFHLIGESLPKARLHFPLIGENVPKAWLHFPLIRGSVPKTLFPPNFNNKTTSVAQKLSRMPVISGYIIHKTSLASNEVIRLYVFVTVRATEVVLFEKLGENEVCLRNHGDDYDMSGVAFSRLETALNAGADSPKGFIFITSGRDLRKKSASINCLQGRIFDCAPSPTLQVVTESGHLPQGATCGYEHQALRAAEHIRLLLPFRAFISIESMRNILTNLRRRFIIKAKGLIQNQCETSTRFWAVWVHFSIDMYSLREIKDIRLQTDLKSYLTFLNRAKYNEM
jgi:hypothetical protein